MIKILNKLKTLFIFSILFSNELALGQKTNPEKNDKMLTTDFSETVKDYKVFDQNIRLSFGRSSAFYYLPSKHIHFSEYKKLIEDSKNKKIPLSFKMKAIKNEILTIEK